MAMDVDNSSLGDTVAAVSIASGKHYSFQMTFERQQRRTWRDVTWRDYCIYWCFVTLPKTFLLIFKKFCDISLNFQQQPVVDNAGYTCDNCWFFNDDDRERQFANVSIVCIRGSPSPPGMPIGELRQSVSLNCINQLIFFITFVTSS